MSDAKVSIPLEVLAWWYRKAQEKIKYYDQAVEYHPRLSETLKRQSVEGYEMALKTVEALKGVFEKNIICETEEKNNE